MSTITSIEPVVQWPELGWVSSPESFYRLSIEQYEAMVASGVFTKTRSVPPDQWIPGGQK